MSQNYVQTEMPSRYCQADEEWIQQQLQRLPPSLRRKVALKYAEVYEITFDAEPVSFRKEKQSKARSKHKAPLVCEKSGQSFTGVYNSAAPGRNAIALLIGTGLKGVRWLIENGKNI